VDNQTGEQGSALRVDNLYAGYGDIMAVSGVSLAVNRGEIVVLFGANGAGKTTTLSAIAGIVHVKSGQIVLDERDVTSVPVHRRVRLGVGLVQENKRIFRRRTVEQNLKLGCFWRYSRKEEIRAALEREFDRFPILRERRKNMAATLSGGEQQMLAISQALVARPTVLMLDEPSAGLAPEVVGRVFNSIAELKEEGMAILMVEQLVHQSLRIADRVGVLELGRVVLMQPASEISDVSEIQSLYFGARRFDRR
jgi:branched-chain amino acid transport system ATP-binding protein